MLTFADRPELPYEVHFFKWRFPKKNGFQTRRRSMICRRFLEKNVPKAPEVSGSDLGPFPTYSGPSLTHLGQNCPKNQIEGQSYTNPYKIPSLLSPYGGP